MKNRVKKGRKSLFLNDIFIYAARNQSHTTTTKKTPTLHLTNIRLGFHEGERTLNVNVRQLEANEIKNRTEIQQQLTIAGVQYEIVIDKVTGKKVDNLITNKGKKNS